MKRPAEVTTLAGAVAYLLAYLFDLLDDPMLLVSITMIIGFLPAVVTYLVVQFRRPPRQPNG